MDDDTANEILDGTYRALCKHGYAELTLQDIADETDKSKASIHYYYDTKEDLFTAFLEFLYGRYTDKVTGVTGASPQARLLSLLDVLLADGEDGPDTEFRTAMLEIRAQGPYNDGIREQLTKFDEFLYEELHSIIEAGIEREEFNEHVDPDLAAEFLTTMISGAHTRRVAVDYSMDRLHETVRAYVEQHLSPEPLEVSC
ncbi:TetR/AcrR family transcriptional regulator [Natrialba sp. PRR66]|uniref:TetR/AcrR family transcriptional regulator n=1 Tax=Natrialba sp. PRR66 TaxID=3098146 RepID=UPI002B1E13B1|nr:TetR/AcrR family transcriptional regulator [Natrialba sp. PRR66]